MSKIVIIPKGTSICPSQRGHYNFYYPNHKECTILTEDLRVSQLYWLGGGNLKAYKIEGQKNVVWAEKTCIKEIE